jgi:hypothetical protein
VLDAVLSVTKRKLDDEGNELDREERNADYLRRLADAGEHARWVCAADKLHNGNSILADLRRTMDPDSVWNRFGGRAAAVRWYRDVHDRLASLGFAAPIMAELGPMVDELERAG